VRETASNATRTIRIAIDQDGVTAAGLPGTADDTSAEDIVAALAAIPGLTAQFTPDGKLDIRAQQGFDFAFSDDTSGALALLGINSYFSGDSAANIGIRSEIANDPTRLGTGQFKDGVYIENAGSLALSNLKDKAIAGLDSRSVSTFWQDTVTKIGSVASSTKSAAEAASVVRESLEAQQAAMSGVSIDEESINLLNFQRQYQASARLISVVDELTQTLLSLI